MKKSIAGPLLTLFFILFSSYYVLAEPIPILEDISFSMPSQDSEQVAFHFNTPCIPKVFSLTGDNPRIIFDFPGAITGNSIKNSQQVQGKVIKRIRVGLHKGTETKTRVVLDLLPDQDITFHHDFDESNAVFTISLEAPAPLASTPEQPPLVQLEAEPVPLSTNTKPPEHPTTKPEEEVTVSADSKSILKDASKANSQDAAAVHNMAKDKLSPASQPLLKEVSFDSTSEKGEMVLFKLNGFFPPIVYGVEEGLPRVVCDFKNTTLADSIKNINDINGKFIKSIRIGKHKNPEKIRVVLDLEPFNSYDLEQVFFKEDNLFVIIVNTFNKPPQKDASEKKKDA